MLSRHERHALLVPWLQTLARLLRDDYKRSGELCLNLISVFLGLSHFAQFHALLVQASRVCNCSVAAMAGVPLLELGSSHMSTRLHAVMEGEDRTEHGPV